MNLYILLFIFSFIAERHSFKQTVFKPVSMFDGKTFRGWEGDTLHTWRIEKGALIGGSLKKEVPHNEFLCTTRSYSNFILQAKFKLTGTGFVNSGIQFHSQRLKDPVYEMAGYQADLGDGYWGSLYDESRRNKTLIGPDSVKINKILKRNDWNAYKIRCEGKRIQIWLNGYQTVDYTESQPNIPQSGIIGLQIHGGGKAQVSYKELTIEELP